MSTSPVLHTIERGAAADAEGVDLYHFVASGPDGREFGLIVTVRTDGPNVFVPCIQRFAHNEAGIDVWVANVAKDPEARQYRDTAATFARLWADGMIQPTEAVKVYDWS